MAKLMPNSLDYDDLLESFRTFLKAQDHLKDYDFDGSAMNVLLRAMAYNATIQAYSDNALFNEGFLDTAERYSSVASNASFLGYTPRSVTSARAVIDMTIETTESTPPLSVTIGPDNLFVSEKDNETFAFRPDKTYTANLDSGKYAFNDVTLIEGDVVSNTFVQQGSAVQSFVIPNAGIDTSSLVVRVYETYSSDTFETYTLFNGDLGKDKAIYFLEMNLDGYYQIEFGDGLVSKALANGNVVYIEYRVGNASKANGCVLFEASFTTISNDTKTLQTVSKASGGADRESVASIRLNAKHNFSMPNGLVTNDDYVSFVKSKYGNIVDDVIAWGGEKMTPPKHGYVYVALKPKESISDVTKQAMIAAMSSMNVGSITPVIVDPKYTTVGLSFDVSYSGLNSAIDPNALKQGITRTVLDYASVNIEQFNKPFIMSDIVVVVKGSNTAITGLRVSTVYRKQFTPVINSANSFTFDFGKQIVPGSVMIDGFRQVDTSITSTYYVSDSNGVLNLYRKDSGTTQLLKQVGTVDYSSGKVNLTDLVVSTSTAITCSVAPEYTSPDLTPSFNEIIKVSVDSCVLTKE